MASPSTNIPNFIKRRCPGASDAELQDARQRFQRYLALAYRIYERGQAAERDSRESVSFDRFDDVGSEAPDHV